MRAVLGTDVFWFFVVVVDRYSSVISYAAVQHAAVLHRITWCTRRIRRYPTTVWKTLVSFRSTRCHPYSLTLHLFYGCFRTWLMLILQCVSGRDK